MKKKILVGTLLVIAGISLFCARGRSFGKYVVLDSASLEVQAVVAEMNSGIGEGNYDKILIVRGKDPLLLSSCTVPNGVWKQIASKGEQIVSESIMVRERIVPDRVVRKPLGCYRLTGIDYYGFEDGSNGVYLISENFGDAGGKFPGKFWEIAVRNQK